MSSDLEPKLAPPGAGLPGVELLVARLLFSLTRATGNRESFTVKFQAEREKTRASLAGLDPALGSRPVLIKRVSGMEDSSRNWSIWMTLDHLRIIHDSIAGIMTALSNGAPPARQASTAAVKPSTSADATIIPRYEASCEALLATVAAIPDLKTAARYAHPWFGPLDALGWYGLAGVHLAIHRVQMERIIAGLAP